LVGLVGLVIAVGVGCSSGLSGAPTHVERHTLSIDMVSTVPVAAPTTPAQVGARAFTDTNNNGVPDDVDGATPGMQERVDPVSAAFLTYPYDSGELALMSATNTVPGPQGVGTGDVRLGNDAKALVLTYATSGGWDFHQGFVLFAQNLTDWTMYDVEGLVTEAKVKNPFTGGWDDVTSDGSRGWSAGEPLLFGDVAADGGGPDEYFKSALSAPEEWLGFKYTYPPNFPGEGAVKFTINLSWEWRW
jgi:hypothetical protein